MENKGLFKNFTKQYQISKTLRFELVPQGETEKFIKEKGLLKQDETRAEDYKKVKKFIDEYHKDFIEKALSGKKLPHQKLKDYLNEFTKIEKDNKAIDKISEALRKEISEWFKDNPTKDKKNMIEEKVPQFLKQQGRDINAELVLKFKGFTTYFSGFNDNRKNIYSGKEQSTAIAYRIVHENLPKFIGNMNNFRLLNKIDFSEVEKQMKIELNGNKLKDVFSLGYFNNCLTQSGIDRYNAIIGGKTDDKGNKIRGVNEKINLFRQQNKLKIKQAPGMARLFKQILSDRASASYLPEKFESPDECLIAIKEFYEKDIDNLIKNNEKKNVINEIESLFTEKLNLSDCDLSNIYIRNNFLTAISQQIFSSYSIITDALRFYFRKEKKETKKLEDETKKYLKKGYFSISEIETALKAYLQETEIENKEKREEVLKQPNPILQYFNMLTIGIEINNKKEQANVVDYFHQKHEDKSVQEVLSREWKDKHELIQDKKAVATIKEYLDSYLHILHFVKPLYVLPPKKENGEIPNKDISFYNEFDELFYQLQSVIPLYNNVRSFLTQKAYSVEKFKLNFENVTLLDGWDVNKEPANTAVILQKDGLYYLGIMNKEHSKVFENIPASSDENDFYEKMYYKLLPGANKMLPKVIFSDKWIDYFSPSKELIDKYEKGTHTKGDNFSLADCHALIDFFKVSIAKHEDWNQFNFNFSPTETYQDISGFYREVEHHGYKITFDKVSTKYIHQLVSEGKLYLFKIYNKDFSPYSKGKPNLHTLYWKAVFGEDNLKDVVVKLNGKAEVFHRPASIPEKSKFIHRKNIPIVKKNSNNSNDHSRFKYDIIKDKRYTENKYQFHVPITLNFKSGAAIKFNDKANQVLNKNSNVNIIGIDRGERHLVYYSLINSNGEITEQGSFNEINNEYKGIKYKTDYQKSLTEKEKARDAARKSWDTIGKIKELKEGYLSQVVHKIASMMIEHNAIVVLEDLNFGFKRGRMKVERQVYQKLEKMLIDKLNYLVFKDREAYEPGGFLNAYQLAAPFTSFKDMGKQTGFIFYVPAANTSKIDFATGFVNLLYPKYENEKQTREFFSKMESIRYNAAKDYFEFNVDYNKFRTDKTDQLKKSLWIICTFGDERYQYLQSKREFNKIDVTEGMKELFKRQNVLFATGNDIKKSITAVKNAQFFKYLIFYLKLILQMRYTDGKDKDYILSPVVNDKGVFFNSENAAEKEPQNADANGAYHIALKGLLLLQKIKEGAKKLAISNKEWYDFVQKRQYRK